MELDKYLGQQDTWSHGHDKGEETAVLTFCGHKRDGGGRVLQRKEKEVIFRWDGWVMDKEMHMGMVRTRANNEMLMDFFIMLCSSVQLIAGQTALWKAGKLPW